jgi:FkbM family methyltransferase
VGANIGAYSLFATLIPSVHQVVAFEADRATRAEFERNVRLNRLEARVQVQAKAISDTLGPLTFGSAGHLSGASGVVASSIHDATLFRDRYTVEATTLDVMFSSAKVGPLAIKIDVEGHEPAVLDGAKSVLGKNQALIQIEIYPDNADKSTRRLDAMGFRKLTVIGPDHYFTNIDSLSNRTEILATYERAVQDMIAYYHREKPIAVERGDFKLEISGKSAEFARRIKKLVGTSR